MIRSCHTCGRLSIAPLSGGGQLQPGGTVGEGDMPLPVPLALPLRGESLRVVHILVLLGVQEQSLALQNNP